MQMYTLRRPFDDVPTASNIAVILGTRPKRPTAVLNVPDMPDMLWDLVERCWCKNAAARPSIAEVIATLTSLGNIS